ncbi:MAG: peptidoglycan DD-metalloendopeptidase family protein [Candidatus Saccharibacteria bacterium]
MLRKGMAAVIITATVAAIAPNPAYAGLSNDNFIPCIAAPVSQDLVRFYQVKPGDSVWEIANENRVSVNTLLAVNNLDSNDLLHTGQRLRIPNTGERLHRLEKGQTMWDIARAYQISTEELVKANPELKDPQRLHVGQVLKIPGSKGYTPAAVPQPASRSLQGLFSWPVFGVITSKFGKRRLGSHHGLDIACPINTPIKAASSGIVSFVGVRRIYGKMVIIKHRNGVETVYAHARKLLVKPGQKVRRGQVIARVGVTGRTTGPHVHFEVRRAGQAVNPLRQLKYL